MFDPQFGLLCRYLDGVLGELSNVPEAPEPWARAAAALGAVREKEPELAAAIDAHDADALRAILDAWKSGKRLLPEQDRETLKRAMTAYRKSLKITRLDSESSIAGGPMSAGRRSAILGITPPSRYPREVWDELARQGRLIAAKQGIYELPPGA